MLTFFFSFASTAVVRAKNTLHSWHYFLMQTITVVVTCQYGNLYGKHGDPEGKNFY